MTAFDLIIRFVVGGTIVALVSWLATQRFQALAGLINIAPVMTTITFVAMAVALPPEQTKIVLKHSLYTVPLFVLFLGSLWFFIDKVSMLKTLAIASAVWTITALIYLWFHKTA